MHNSLEALLKNYKPSPEVIKKVKSIPKLFLVGVTAAGKNTLINKLLQTGNYHLIISHTTRALRKNSGVMETDGVEYHFIDQDQLKRMLVNKEFIEAKRFALNFYGTSVSEFDEAARSHQTALAEIEIQGVDEYMSMAPDSTTAIFLLPPDFNTWQSRLIKRSEQNTNPLEVSERLKAAKIEITHALSKDYYSFVVNNNLDKAFKQVESIVNGIKQEDSVRQRNREIARQLLIGLA